MTVSYVNAVRELSKKMKSDAVCNMIAEVLKLKFVAVSIHPKKKTESLQQTLFTTHKSYKKAATDVEARISETSLPLASLLQDVFSTIMDDLEFRECCARVVEQGMTKSPFGRSQRRSINLPALALCLGIVGKWV